MNVDETIYDHGALRILVVGLGRIPEDRFKTYFKFVSHPNNRYVTLATGDSAILKETTPGTAGTSTPPTSPLESPATVSGGNPTRVAAGTGSPSGAGVGIRPNSPAPSGGGGGGLGMSSVSTQVKSWDLGVNYVQCPPSRDGLEVFQVHRRVLGIIGVIDCDSCTDIRTAYDQLEEIRLRFASSLLGERCVGFYEKGAGKRPSLPSVLSSKISLHGYLKEELEKDDGNESGISCLNGLTRLVSEFTLA